MSESPLPEKNDKKTLSLRAKVIIFFVIFLILFSAEAMFGAYLRLLPDMIAWHLRPASCPSAEEHEWELYGSHSDSRDEYRCKKCRQSRRGGGIRSIPRREATPPSATANERW